MPRCHRSITDAIMFKLVVLAAALAIAQATTGQIGFPSFSKRPSVDPRVLDGQKAVVGQFPYQVSLHLKGPLLSSHYCGGSLLTPSTVLTAGHCVTEVQVGALQHVEVLAGLVSQSNQGDHVQVSRVSKSIVHPEFPGQVAPNDLAIHILATPFKLNQYVNVIALPSSDAQPEGLATLSGWGSTSHTQIPSLPDVLQWEDLPIVPIDQCLDAVEGENTPLDDTMVCTGPLTGGYGACNGDSGGPLVQNGTLVGVVSWGFVPCGGAGNPSVFTRTSAHLEFIKSNTV